LWGAPSIHGALLMLGIDVYETSIANYMIVLGERHLRQVMKAYADYDKNARTHLPMGKGAPNRTKNNAVWENKIHSSLGRITPSVCPDMVFGRDRCRDNATSQKRTD
jgi:hypothetical protein